MLMLDIDYFKRINDTYGHQVGDVVLVTLAKKIQNMTRDCDIFARIGGEEFALLLYNTSIEDAKVVGQEICHTIASHDFIEKEQYIDVTISIGVATLNHDINSLDTLQYQADQKLYEAKESGRNCVR